MKEQGTRNRELETRSKGKGTRGTVCKILVLLISLTLAVGGFYNVTYAEDLDPLSNALGFQVVSGEQQIVVWRPRVTVDVYYSNVLVGSASIDIGFARRAGYIYRNNYSFYRMDTTMLNIRSCGAGNSQRKIYGYSDYLHFRALYPNAGDELLNVFPVDIPGTVSNSKTEANSLSYSFSAGNSISAGMSNSASISTSQSFVESALGLFNASDIAKGKVDIRFDYTDNMYRNTWKVYSKYAYYLSEQKASFTYLTKKAKYKRSMIFEASYYLWNNIPSYSNCKWIQSVGGPDGHTSVSNSVIIIPPFPQ